MATNSISLRVAQKERRLFFASPVAWLFLGSFAATCLFVFFWVESFFARNVADVRPLFAWMPILLIFLSAAITMRMWSDERRDGTLEHVITQPQGLWRFVLGKFIACFSLLVIALIMTLPIPATVAAIAQLDWGPVVASYLAAGLLGGAYISIGLYVSAGTDNAIVSLMGTVLLAGLLYFIGTATFTGFFSETTAQLLRQLSTGARFESIARGVIDLRDLFYYVSLMIIFGILNIYSLEKERWARAVSTSRHRQWRALTALVVLNALLANTWLQKISPVRVDVTEGRIYSIAQPTFNVLDQLQEPLLIRGYFSSKTHPLLSPLAPQLRDLISEYQAAGKGNVRVEFVDPAQDPDLETEANEFYGIRATPFQISDRHQSAVVNSYFNVLIKYGDEHESLGFSDLIEIKATNSAQPEILLRNPEFDISHSIKQVLQRYRASGDLFEGIEENVEFIAYVSNDSLLPQRLIDYRAAIEEQLNEIAQHANGKFNIRFIEPEARDAEVARKIRDEWGFRPMVASLSEETEFFFYLTLANSQQVVQLPTDTFDASQFRTTLEAGLKRFAGGLAKTVSLAVPAINEQMAKYQLGAPTYNHLEKAIGKDHMVIPEDLADGQVAAEADALVVAGPSELGPQAVFAIDQYLMRGGTVILASSPYSAEISGGEIRMQPWASGLDEWLQHQGIQIDDALIMDEQNARFPLPVIRKAKEKEFREVQVVDYPFFLDVRRPGLSAEHPITADLPQLTMAWASPISAQRNAQRRTNTVVKSSADAWLSKSLDVTPQLSGNEIINMQQSAAQGPLDIGVALEGRFESWYQNHSTPTLASAPEDETVGQFGNLILNSPESAKLVVYASNDFLDDQVLSAGVAAAGTQYLGPLQLVLNTLDWALQDDDLLKIRSRAHFNRTLPAMNRKQQRVIEYSNYAIAAIILLLIALVHKVRRYQRKRSYIRRMTL